LAFASFSLFSGLHGFTRALSLNPPSGTLSFLFFAVGTAASLVLFLVLTSRLVLVATGRRRLETISASGIAYWLRLFAIVVMSCDLVRWMLPLVGTLFKAAVSGVPGLLLSLLLSFGLGSGLGALLFEISRLLEREPLSESGDET
jgi:hypothetical protein